MAAIRVLYISVHRDGTGYARAAQDYLRAMATAGIDVVARPLRLGDCRETPPAQILELENKSSRGCDVVIQHTLPSYFIYDGHFRRNIGLFASETSSFRNSCWADRINALGEAWVINRQQVEACQESGVTVPVSVVPHTTDMERFQRSYPVFPKLRHLKEDGVFLFYTIGEHVRRKNLGALVRAFHAEFDPYEPVRLVIKTNVPGKSPAESKVIVQSYCDEAKRSLKLRGGYYADEIILTERLTDEGVLSLHATCDCFVQPSHGESWSQPAFDAMAMGKTPIVTDWSGYRDWLSSSEGWLVYSHPEAVFGVTESPNDLYTGDEYWAAADIAHLRQCLRAAYENQEMRSSKAAAGIERAYDFSYEKIGSYIKGLLSDDPQELARRASRSSERIE